MIYLFFEILAWLAAAFVLGGGVVWGWFRVRQRRVQDEMQQASASRQQRLLAERDAHKLARDALAEQVPVLEASLADRSVLIAELEQQIDELRSLQPETEAELERQKGLVAAAVAKYESAKSKTNQLKSADESRNAQIENLASCLRSRELELEKQSQELHAFRERLPALEQRLADFENEARRSAEQGLQQRTKEARQIQRVEGVMEQVETLQREREALLWRAETDEKRIAEAEAAAASAAEAADQLTRDLDAHKARLRAGDARVAELLAETSRLAALEAHAEHLQSKLEAQRNELRKLTARAAGPAVRADDDGAAAAGGEAARLAREELVDWRHRCERVQREAAEARSAQDTLTVRVRELERALMNSTAVPEAELLEAPVWLLESEPAEVDDLQQLKGVGPILESRLHELGIFHYRQLADMTDADALWICAQVKRSPERIKKEGWREQARELAAGQP